MYVETLAQALHIHIEGSATIAFEDGSEVNLTTDGHNGHPYQNPLRLLLKDKRIPDDFQPPPSQSRTQAYVTAHPEVLREYWGKNPHFVFKETPLRGRESSESSSRDDRSQLIQSTFRWGRCFC